MTDLSLHYDLVIVGGGVTGLSLLLGLKPYLLNKQISSVLLIDKSHGLEKLPGRSIALNAETLNYFQQQKFSLNNQEFSVLDLLAADLEPINRILVKTDTNPQNLLLQANKHQLDQFGGVIDLALLQQRLQQIVDLIAQQHLLNIQYLTDCNVEQCKLVADETSSYRSLLITDLTSQRQSEITADLVIVANGAQKIKGLDNPTSACQQLITNQQGIIADLNFKQPINSLAIEYFTEHGPVALLPTGRKSACLVYCTTEPEEFNHLKSSPSLLATQVQKLLNSINDLTEFCQASNHRLPTTLNTQNQIQHGTLITPEANAQLQISEISQTVGYPLNAWYLTKLYEPNLVYLGNAAHTLHPVSGQGFNLAILGIKNFLLACNQTLTKAKSQDNQDHARETFAAEVNQLAFTYNKLQLPIVTEVFNRTSLFATEFTAQGKAPDWFTNFSLYHLIAYPSLQSIVIEPSLGRVKTNSFSKVSALLNYLS